MKLISTEILLNQDFNYEGKTINLMKYYEEKHGIKIKNRDQLIIIVRKENAQGDPLNLYFIPELCHLVGIDDEDVMNTDFMKKVSEFTKLEPTDKVIETNKFIELFQDTNEDRDTHWSSKKKAEHYGIQINPLKELFSAYYMTPAQLKDGKNKKVTKDNKADVNLVKSIPIPKKKWLFIYEKQNYDDVDFLNKSLQKAAGKYHIKIEEPEWIEQKEIRGFDWIIKSINEYLKEGKYVFVLFY